MHLHTDQQAVFDVKSGIISTTTCGGRTLVRVALREVRVHVSLHYIIVLVLL
jgi:hypothetical protein